jgi:uridine kinase
VAAGLAASDLGHPLRVAIDGITGVGKTTFARAITAALAARGVTAVHVTMDGFHHPRAVRHRQGRDSADGYYEDAYDLDAMRRVLLDPLGPGGDRRYRTAVIDLATDTPVDDPPRTAGVGDVLVVDGSFLQRSELREGWDVVVFLDASFEAAEARGAARDAEAFGGIDGARAAFRSRYHAAQRRYLAECNPAVGADVVIDAEDVTALRLVRTQR